jgi:lipopolysaccharide/colanic/teichoic acid biosynthesis glycosyltransferase
VALSAKVIFDATFSATALWLFSPVWVAAAGAIWLFDGRPVVFRQRRVGYRGRDFTLLKFRTMREVPAAEQGRFDPGDRRRVTRVGEILRKTKIDELPQLLNVLRGDMSLVGPRPEIRKWVEAYPARWSRVLQVKPGITDPASIRYRNEEDLLATSPDPERMYREEILPHKLDLYEAYLAHQSFLGDLLLLAKTVPALLSRR